MVRNRSVNRMAFAVRFFIVCCLAFTAAACNEQSSGPAVVVRNAQGVEHRFTVELASTDEQRGIGLMHRESLAENHGMLFDFQSAQEVGMWMKNTLIPLDMIFIKADGRIARIEQNTEPHSTRVIYSGDLVRYVLEVSGGATKAMGIAAGDRVTLPQGLNIP